VSIDELRVRDSRVPRITGGERTEPASLLPIPDTAHTNMTQLHVNSLSMLTKTRL